jgi:hypothetical protein
MEMIRKKLHSFSKSSFGKYIGLFEALPESGLTTLGVFAQAVLLFPPELVSCCL